MANLFSSSIGRKLVMSISGCFLILFLLFHLTMNIVVLFSAESYNAICAFLGANWYALVGTLVLAAGVALHILYATWLTLGNRRARGEQRYAVTAAEQGVSWASKNMYILGLVIACGLLMHLYNFWYNMQLVELRGEHVNALGTSPKNGAALIAGLFSQPLYCVIYLVWLTAIWFHLTHGMWSMFQTVGWANRKWYPRLKWCAQAIATLMMLGFAAVVIVFYVRSLEVV
ncbi:fumarate reductase [Bacteroidia bacterium]|nr:fumarate reductase [Bacteroidia bacterium]